MQNYNHIQDLVNSGANDYLKFVAGNKTAGTRLRKTLLEIKQLAQVMRKEISEVKNAKK